MYWNVLEPVSIPFGLDSIGRGFIFFQDDNTRPHAACIISEFHENSPDYTHTHTHTHTHTWNFHPIDIAWDMLGGAVSQVNRQPTKEELPDLQVQWGNIHQMKIKNVDKVNEKENVLVLWHQWRSNTLLKLLQL